MHTLHSKINNVIRIIIIRGALDPEFCYPAGSGSTLNPDMSDPAGTGSYSLGSGRILIQTSTPANNRRKITLSALQLEETGMTVYPVLSPNFYLSDN